MNLFGYKAKRVFRSRGKFELLLLEDPEAEFSSRYYFGKLVWKGEEPDEDARKLTNEMEIFQSVQGGPFIMNMIARCQDQKKILLVLDLLPKRGKLSEWLKKPFFEEEVKFFAAEMLLGIEYLHSRGIIHKDIKPDKIGIDRDGHVAIMGLELSEYKEGPCWGIEQSKTGTPYYMAPEVGDKSYTEKVDWWSYGITLLTLLVGRRPPFQNCEDLVKIIDQNTPSSMSLVAADFLKKLLKSNKEERLGARHRGAQEIKEHPFFSGIEWDKLLAREVPPPNLLMQ